MAQHIVLSSPRSCDDVAPTCFLPRLLTTLPRFCTVVIPVSSRFKMFSAPKWCLNKNHIQKFNIQYIQYSIQYSVYSIYSYIQYSNIQYSKISSPAIDLKKLSSSNYGLGLHIFTQNFSRWKSNSLVHSSSEVFEKAFHCYTIESWLTGQWGCLWCPHRQFVPLHEGSQPVFTYNKISMY